jgi:hypothetical protein
MALSILKINFKEKMKISSYALMSKTFGWVLFICCVTACGNEAENRDEPEIEIVDMVEDDTAEPNPVPDPLAGLNCTEGGAVDDEPENPINVGRLDDRTCYANYMELSMDGNVYGVYEIAAGSNHKDTNGLQPRMERALTPRVKPTGGNFSEFSAIYRIAEVGDTGSYFAQTKGKHTGGGGSPDPAICLFIAQSVIIDGEVTHFDIYREEITERGGTLQDGGRQNVYLTRVAKNEDFTFYLKTGFEEEDGVVVSHYSNAMINGESFDYDIPDPKRATETGIRYGAYRVRGGKAKFYIRNTVFNFKND